MSALVVQAVGPLALIVDRGRPGQATVGVGEAGPADRAAFASGARLVGNDTTHAGLELLLGGLTVRAEERCVVALTGAPAPAFVTDAAPAGERAGERAVWFGEALALAPGAVLRVGVPATGLRSYLSVRGGVDVAPVLGSRSADTLSGIGPAPVRAGDVLPVGATAALPAPGSRLWVAPPPSGAVVLDVLAGPRHDWLAVPDELTRWTWAVSSHSDRIGVRLSGPALRRAAATATAELPSEGVMRGAVQLPPSGEPVVFGADHPTTGGYPVVAVLTERSADDAAQLRPGQVVSFHLLPATEPVRPRTDPD